MSLRKQGGRIYRHFRDIRQLASQIAAILSSKDVEISRFESFNLAPQIWQRKVAADVTLSSGTETELITKFGMRFQHDSVLLITQSVAVTLPGGSAHSLHVYPYIDSTSYETTGLVINGNTTGAFTVGMANTLTIKVQSGSHVLTWVAKRTAGAGSVVVEGDNSNILVMALSDDNIDIDLV